MGPCGSDTHGTRTATLLLVVVAATWGCAFDTGGVPVDPALIDGPLETSRRDGGPDQAADGPLDRGPDAPRDAAGDRDQTVAPDGVAEQGPDQGPLLAALAKDDGRLWIGEKSGLVALRWDSAASSWKPELALPTLQGSSPRWIVNRVLGSSEEVVVFKSEASGSTLLQLAHWTGTAWSVPLSTPVSGTTTRDERTFDVELEPSSGHVLYVFADGSKRPRYATYDGSSWSAAAPLPVNAGSSAAPDLTHGVIRWVELAPRPSSDEIALIFAADDERLGALLWDGSSWNSASAKQITDELRANGPRKYPANRVADVAFEDKNGEVLVAWGSSDGYGFAYRSWGGSSWSSESSNSITQGYVSFVDLRAKPGDDDIAAAFLDLDGTERLGGGTWKGTYWSGDDEYDSQIRDANDKAFGRFPAAVGWDGNQLVCAYAGKDKGKLYYFTNTTGKWGSPKHLKVGKLEHVESVFLVPAGSGSALMALFSDDKSKLYAAIYDGGWTLTHGGKPVSSSLSSASSVPFSFDYLR